MRIKKSALAKMATIFALFVLIAVVFGTLQKSGQTSPSNQTQVQTIKTNEILFIEPQKLSSTQSLSPYKDTQTFISNEITSDFPFTSVGGSWEEIKPNGTSIESELRFKVDGKWSDWIEVEEEEDVFQESPQNPGGIRKYGMGSTNPATAFQYKFIMYGDGSLTPQVYKPEWTFLKVASLSPQPQPSYGAFSTSTKLASISITGANGVVSRAAWGADESYRYLSDNSIDPVLIEIDESYRQKFADELAYSRVVEADSNGDKYKWPLQYSKEVKKFVIHHTATSGNLDNPPQAIRDIYYYHAITRGWGDIGYNYIVDQQGKIYEGRYGGEGVIGAHSGPGNNGSIGIAVLGNYEENDVPESIITSLSKFIAEKAKIHNISPNAYSEFRNELMPNIFGHKDIMATQCPGVYLYDKLPIIRTLAAQANEKKKPRFVKDYDYEDSSDLYYIELQPDETKQVKVKFENIGTETWNSETVLIAMKDDAHNGVISFPSDPIIRAKMSPSTVKSGEFATFTFDIKSGKRSDIVYLNLAPVFNGTKTAFDTIKVPVAVQQIEYLYSIAGQKDVPKTVTRKEKFQYWVKLKNTGNITWERDSENPVILTSKTLKGTLTEKTVKPGEIGTFVIEAQAPRKLGYYQEYFVPEVVGITKMADSGINFKTTVLGGEYEAKILELNADKIWPKESKTQVTISLHNLGQTTWTRQNFKLEFAKREQLKITDAKLNEKTVKPGETGTVTFNAEVTKDETDGKKPLKISFKVDGNPLLKRASRIYYSVVDSSKIQEINGEKEGNIRVKLSFSGDPQITASGAYEVYSTNGTLLSTLAAGEISSVTMQNGKYKITTPATTHLVTEPVRFKPKNSAILRIENFDHHPSWNTSLNDNEYRGVLEVNNVDGTLTIINDLPLEDYLKGLGEVSNGDNSEKIKTIIVSARTYAKYYMEIGEKFPGKPYNLDDDPNVSQKYLGYGLEKRAPNMVKAIEDTRGQVVTYNGELIKTPYFNQSDGTSTKSAEDVWGWANTPYLVSVSDTYCSGTEFLGHGVGLSGCGATGMAENGFTYLQILKHYYIDTEITDLY